jgi:putative flippase GtrA
VHNHTFKQFVRFSIVGATNTLLDFCIYLLLTRGFPFWSEHVVGAASVSFCFGVTSSFILNSLWTFGGQHFKWTRCVKFFCVALGGLAWNALIIHILIQFGTHDIIAKLLATATVLMWNFTLQKRWTFGA